MNRTDAGEGERRLRIEFKAEQAKDISTQSEAVNPRWLAIKNFKGEKTAQESLSALAEIGAVLGGLYSVYASYMGESGMMAHISYLSMGWISRKIASATIGKLIYPATSFNSSELIKIEVEQIQELRRGNFTLTKLCLSKVGLSYDAALITHPETIQNGRWTINALGNMMTMENSISHYAKKNFAHHCSTLLVNGPNIGRSVALATRYGMGAGFNLGIEFLEKEVQATHIIMEGFSLGGGMMAEAILNHDFSTGLAEGIRYLSITDRSFSNLSSIAAKLKGPIVMPAFYVSGFELDGVEAARKLSQLAIKQIIIQHCSSTGEGSDGVIPDSVSLASEVHKDRTLIDKIFLESRQISHYDELPLAIKNKLKHSLQEFLTK